MRCAPPLPARELSLKVSAQAELVSGLSGVAMYTYVAHLKQAWKSSAYGPIDILNISEHDEPMKLAFAAEFYRKIGEGLGLLNPHSLEETAFNKVKRALDMLEEIQADGRSKIHNVTAFRQMVNEGRP
jgi:hypothetical protein